MVSGRKISSAIVLCAILACMLLTAGCSSGVLHTIQYANEKNKRQSELQRAQFITIQGDRKNVIDNASFVDYDGIEYWRGGITNPTNKTWIDAQVNYDIYISWTNRSKYLGFVQTKKINISPGETVQITQRVYYFNPKEVEYSTDWVFKGLSYKVYKDE
jgi:hypothetical protein